MCDLSQLGQFVVRPTNFAPKHAVFASFWTVGKQNQEELTNILFLIIVGWYLYYISNKFVDSQTCTSY